MSKKSVITIAVGKTVYIEMALNLAKSFLLWNKNNGIEFILVTDRLDIVRQSPIYKQITVLSININDYDEGFAIKLHLDKFLQTEYSLFIDCDCLIYANLNPVFEKFKGHTVATIGKKVVDGDFFGDVSSIMSQFDITYLPKFVGAIYYIEKGELATLIFEFARATKFRYDEIGLIRLRGKENEEPLIAISMAKFNQQPIADDGSIKADRMFFDQLFTNVLKGRSELWNITSPPVPTYSTLMHAKPTITHFNSAFADTYEYKSERYRLALIYKNHFSTMLSNILTNFIIIIPGKSIVFGKNIIRPFYRFLFGFRKIKQTNR